MEVKMMDNSLGDEYSFERYPGNKKSGEISEAQREEAARWNEAMMDAPSFSEDKKFGIANENNDYYGEKIGSQQETEGQYNEAVSDAASLINYGLDEAARRWGVEYVVQAIEDFNGTTVEELFSVLKSNAPAKQVDIRDESDVTKVKVAEFREGVNAPSQEKSPEGFLKAIANMKELISEVKGADPRYEKLRAGARAAGMGYFEYAVSNLETRGLVELFNVLAAQGEANEVKDEEYGEKRSEDDEVFKGNEKPEEVIDLNPEAIDEDVAA